MVMQLVNSRPCDFRYAVRDLSKAQASGKAQEARTRWAARPTSLSHEPQLSGRGLPQWVCHTRMGEVGKWAPVLRKVLLAGGSAMPFRGESTQQNDTSPPLVLAMGLNSVPRLTDHSSQESGFLTQYSFCCKRSTQTQTN